MERGNTKHPLEYLSESHDLIELHEFMDDEDFTNALDLVMKCIAKPNPPMSASREALLLMQAYSFKFRMQSKVYDSLHKGRAGTSENIKKNVYYSASEQCHELAQTLKYICKETL